jgi:hypothetical protein
MGALWTPPSGVGLLTHHAVKRTVTLKDGRSALVTVDDSGTVTQVECGDRLDAIVRPKTVRIQIRKGPGNAEH